MNKITVLGSGSSGNCYLLDVNNEILIIDCGIPYKKILTGLEYRLDKVVGCVVTHLHNDHSKAIPDLIKNSINVYSMWSVFEHKNVDNYRCKKIRPGEKFKVGNYQILAFDLEHDVENVGFLIYHKDIGKLLYITDTYYCKYRFPGIDHLLIECNYAKSIIDETLKDKQFLRNRIVKSHFELSNVIDFLKANETINLKNLVLIHLSDSNSDRDVFKEVIHKEVGIPVTIAEKDLKIYL